MVLQTSGDSTPSSLKKAPALNKSQYDKMDNQVLRKRKGGRHGRRRSRVKVGFEKDRNRNFLTNIHLYHSAATMRPSNRIGFGHCNELIEFHVFSQSNCLKVRLGAAGRLSQSFQRARVLAVSAHILLLISCPQLHAASRDAHISIHNAAFNQTQHLGC